MIEYCYVDAGEDEIKSNACDLVERDVLDALWRGLPFHKLLSVNTNKYMNVEGEIENETLIFLI